MGGHVGAPHVLVVEDETDIRDLIALHLSREGFRCRTASNGVDALAEVRSSHPDLVVLDLMLPGLGGLEVCRRLRAEPATASLPIIMLTAKADEVDRVVGLELGADERVRISAMLDGMVEGVVAGEVGVVMVLHA